MGFGVWGLGFGVWGLGFGVWGGRHLFQRWSSYTSRNDATRHLSFKEPVVSLGHETDMGVYENEGPQT